MDLPGFPALPGDFRTGFLDGYANGSARLAFSYELGGCLLVNGELPAIQILETSRLEETPRNLVPVHTAPMAWLLAGIADQTGCLILLIP